MNAPVSLPQRGREIAELVAEIRELCGDDDVAFIDTLDGATDAVSAAREAVRTVAAMEALADAAKALSERYKARSGDFAGRADRGRAALAHFLAEIGEKSLVLPEGTVGLAKGRAKVVGDPDVDALPAEFVRVKREPDKAAIKAALEAGRVVPGCSLSNSPPTLQIRSR